MHGRQSGNHVFGFRAQHIRQGNHADASVVFRYKNGPFPFGAEFFQCAVNLSVIGNAMLQKVLFIAAEQAPAGDFCGNTPYRQPS